MAREAGLAPICEGCDVPDVSYAYESWDVELKAFEALVRADERNSWPAEMEAMERQVNILTDALAKAKADEREKCAQICDDQAEDEPYGHAKFRCTNIAAAIRARSNT
jgi:hypothetical protein